MAALRAGRWARVLHKTRGQVFGANTFVAARAASGPSKDLQLGAFPETPAEKAAAASKYNIPLRDYESYPDDGMGYGDYPKLVDRSQHERDPWYDWDHPDLRRNWGEPIHWDFDLLIRNRVDTSPTANDWRTMTTTLFGFFGFMMLMFVVGEYFPSYQPVAPKQYPYNNLYLEKGGDPEKAPEEVKNYTI